MTDAAALSGRVEAALGEFLAGRTADLAKIGTDLEPMADAARSFVLDGGKRLRPMFAYWGWRTTCGRDVDDAAMVRAAASLELLHGCALVHDDVMDGSATRRGRPSTHAAFAQMHRSGGLQGDAEVFGTAVAILLGDMLLSWSDAMFTQAGLDDAAAGRARVVFDDMRQQVMAGQYLDVLGQARGAFSVSDALRVIEYKTSKYTVEGPLLFGAAAADASPEVVASLSAYGLPLGEAFQLRDDVLGVFGDPQRTGKPAGDDLREGKRTLLVALAMEHADAAQTAALHAHLGQRDLDERLVDELRTVIVATGALAAVEDRICRQTADARAALAAPDIDPYARSVLDDLALAASQRQR